jgi:hypothetical protein
VRATLAAACSIGGPPPPGPPESRLHRDSATAVPTNPYTNGAAGAQSPCEVAPVLPTHDGGGRFSPVDSLVMTYPPPHKHRSPAVFRRAAGSWKGALNRPTHPRQPPGRDGRGPPFGPVCIQQPAFLRVTTCTAHCRRGHQARRSLRASGFIPPCRPRQRVVSQPDTRRSGTSGPAGDPAGRVRPAAPGGRKGKPGAKSSSVCCQSRRGWLVLAEIYATLLWGRPAMP